MMEYEGMHEQDEQGLDAAGSGDGDVPERFDPSTCCDRAEQVMIAAMRSILRPDEAPACLYEKLRTTLDRCCGQSEHTVIRHTTIIRYRSGGTRA